MAKLPYMQFYCDDWLSDEKLRACSSAARGLWIDVLCLMHKNDRRGHLQLDGKPVTPVQLARMTGRTVEEVSLQLAELIDAGVPSVSATGDLFSRRMVRDEQIRQVRSEAGSKGGKATQGVCSSKSSSKVEANGQANSQQKCGSEYGSGIEPLKKGKRGPGGKENQNGFDEFWSAYPRHQSKQDAIKAWNRLSPSPELQGLILAAVARQKTWRPWMEGIIPHGATWLNGRKWEDEPPPEAIAAPKVVKTFVTPPADPRTPEQKAADLAADRKRVEADKAQAASAAELLAKLRGGIGQLPEENP